ncbi:MULTISPECIES: RNA polymerase sigma factor [Tenacibaculum]|nr:MULTISPECIES: RNA polymerase sigma factor [Tenacibaculum]MCF2876513.1 RNA polymerase sigma factor [Tenacibaculum sp. Cn5-1]MCF2936580.1 RNA polymerase sigma factor [Tenacibaculum sp. Cn5-34]MCG7511827.1 RNA polymerase sigma factor [Tenacibaculum sp. Cn5-46]
MNTLSDNALMLKVKNGEHHKLGLLYERYKKRLFGYFYHMNKDAGLSEDLVQNVFVRVLKYKHTYTEESKFITWIFQIARNEGYDYYRKQKKHQHQDIDEVGYNLNHSDDFQQKMEVLEKKTILKRAMEQLSSEKREVLTLSKFKELKYKEVGEIIGCTEGAARTKVHRALFELKEIYLTLEKR